MQKYRQHLPILLLLIVALAIGLLTVRQFGESWDELQFFKYADNALQAYSAWPTTGTVPLTGNTYDNYGPAYVMLVALGARFLRLIVPWLTSDIRHVLYLVTWLVAIWVFYAFSRRWLMTAAAFGATLLFSTQPLFWGHAFISPKDIPFLAFFLLSLESGLRMVDNLAKVDFDPADLRERQLPLIATGTWLVGLLIAFIATPAIQAWVAGQVNAAAAGQSNVISHIASHITPQNVGVYTRRYFVFSLWIRAAFFVVSAAILLWAWQKVPGAMGLLGCILPAAILLGITTSIRVVGPFAAVLVVCYALWRRRRASLLPLGIYAVFGLIAMYLSWPYLWPDPLGHLIESVRVMAEYPWRGQVLFDGSLYASTAIPRSYLPVLLGIQLTEPVWFLFAIGLAVAVYDASRRNVESIALLLLAGIWFVLPLLGFIVTRSPLYDNFRQIFFILPPVFLLAGLVFQRIRQPAIRAALIALVILPGLIAGIQLHPYEYIYYNQFIGGVRGAFRRYELDYWGTSYRDAAGYLNQVAPSNATVWVEGPTHILQLYARPDLKIYSTNEVERADHYDYVVALTRDDLDLKTYPGAPIAHVIARYGSDLTVIKKP